MRIECPQCAAGYDVKPASVVRRAKCVQCGAALTVPASDGAASEEPQEPEQPRPRAGEQGRLLVPALVVAIVSLLLGLVFVPLTVLVGVGTAVAAATGEVSSQRMGMAMYMLVANCAIAGSLVGGGIGLVLRKPWGWWATVVVYAFFLLLNLKLVSPVLGLQWGFAEATSQALSLVLLHGLPILVALVMVVLLFLPSVRLAYGIKQREVTRHRKAGSLRSRS